MERRTVSVLQQYNTPFVINPELLGKVYSHKLSTILYPLPFVHSEDTFDGLERRGEKTRFYFNNFQLYYDVRLGTHIGFKESYYHVDGQTYYKMKYSPDYLKTLEEHRIHFRPALTMPQEYIRQWFPIRRMVVLERKYIRGKMLDVTGPLHHYPDLDKHHWILLLNLNF